MLSRLILRCNLLLLLRIWRWHIQWQFHYNLSRCTVFHLLIITTAWGLSWVIIMLDIFFHDYYIFILMMRGDFFYIILCWIYRGGLFSFIERFSCCWLIITAVELSIIWVWHLSVPVYLILLVCWSFGSSIPVNFTSKLLFISRIRFLLI